MILRDEWFRFDDRCLTHPGVIIDIGCLGWDWSGYFFNKKRVIGFDCNENTQPPGAELRRQLVLPLAGKTLVYGEGAATSAVKLYGQTNGIEYDVVSLDSVLAEFSIMPSLLKINAEGSEYPLLFSLKAPPADQLIVSFHDFLYFPYPKYLSEIVRQQLSVWYNWTVTSTEWSWWLGLLKDEFRVSHK